MKYRGYFRGSHSFDDNRFCNRSGLNLNYPFNFVIIKVHSLTKNFSLPKELFLSPKIKDVRLSITG